MSKRLTEVENELVVTKRSKTKSKSKKSKKSDTSKNKSSGKKKGSKKKSSKRKDDSSVDEVDLYDIVSSNASLVPTIDQWIKAYTNNSPNAVLQLVNFIVKCCGCDAQISAEQYRTFEEETTDSHDEILASLGAHEVEKVSGRYPLISKSKEEKHFRTYFLDFWKKLLFQCQREIIYDSYFLETILAWLIVISQSPVRAFRHTATVAALQIQSSIITIASQQRKQQAVNDRQLQAEKRKKKSSQKKESDLTEICNKLNEQIAHIETLMTEVIESVYDHRYRDVNPQIRTECVTYLGEWILEYPSFFANNAYFKRLGFALSDPKYEIREASAVALRKLYSAEEIFLQMDMFTAKFKPRILQLMEDKWIPTAVVGIQLCSELAHRDILSENEIYDIYAFISDYDARVRQASGDFIVDFLLDNVIVERVKEKIASSDASKRPEEKELTIAKICSILELIQERTQHTDLPDYAVDVMWGRADFLRDWETMSELLLSPPTDIDLSDSEQVLLAKLLTACVKRASGEVIVPKLKSDPHHKDSAKTIQENLINLTSCLVKTLPQIMEKYIAEPDVVAHVAQIPQYFVLDLYAEYGLEQHLDKLLEVMKQAFTRSINEDAHRNIATTMQYLKTEAHKQQKSIEVAIVDLIEKTYKNFKSQSRKVRDSLSKSTSGSISRSAEEESEDSRNVSQRSTLLSLNIQRLNSFHAIEDIELTVQDDYFEELDKILSATQISDEVVIQTLAACQYVLLWAVSKIDPADTSFRQQQPIADKSEKLFAHMEYLIEDSNPPLIREATFFRISDCLLLFNRTLKSYNTSLGGLAFKPTKEFVNKIKGYFQTEMKAMENTNTLHEEEKENEEIPIGERESSVCIRKTKFLAALGKLIVFSAFPGSFREHVPDILIHFVDHGRSVEEVIKAFLIQYRKCMKHDFDVMFHTLIRKYDEVEASHETDEKKKFLPLYKLAKRLADSYGVYNQRSHESRVSLANLVGECISWVHFSVETKQRFLTYAANHFVSKLDALAAKSVLDHFEAQFEGVTIDEKDTQYEPFIKFRDHLRTVCEKGGRTGKPPKKGKATVEDPSLVPPPQPLPAPQEESATDKTTDIEGAPKKKKKDKKSENSKSKDTESKSDEEEQEEPLQLNRKQKVKRKSTDDEEPDPKKPKTDNSPQNTSSSSKPTKRKSEGDLEEDSSSPKRQKTTLDSPSGAIDQ